MAVIIPAILVIGGGLAGHILQQMGDLPDLSQYRSLEYFDGEQFVSPVKIEYFSDRVTGGETGFKRFVFRSPNAPEQELPKVKLELACLVSRRKNLPFTGWGIRRPSWRLTTGD